MKSTAGFALILSLMLGAFLLLLCLSFSLLLHTQLVAHSSQLAHLRQQQHARLALFMGIGQLQKHAGPDTAISTPAALSHPEINPYWTGIWDSANLHAPPKWLVTDMPSSELASAKSIDFEILSAKQVNFQSAHTVTVPSRQLLSRQSEATEHIGWWTRDEGVKIAMAKPAKHPAALLDESFKYPHSDALSSWCPEEPMAPHSLNSLRQRIIHRSQHKQLHSQANWFASRFHEEVAEHALTLNSYGVLASTHPMYPGLMQDLSRKPAILGAEFARIIQDSHDVAEQQSKANTSLAALQLRRPIQAPDLSQTLQDGQCYALAAPILSNCLLALTIRCEAPVTQNPNFRLKGRFFCELWNPYTHQLSLTSDAEEPLHLELSIGGLPTVYMEKVSNGQLSAPINLQTLLQPSNSSASEMVIQLKDGHLEPWLPGQSKNWTGIQTQSADGFQSTQTEYKAWNANAHTLGGAAGMDTGVPRLTGAIRPFCQSAHSLSLRLYLVDPVAGSRRLLSQLSPIRYEAINTRPQGYANTHSGTTFGYHIQLRGPEHSQFDNEYYRGRWLYDHDPRNPQPVFNDDWQLANHPAAAQGSAYIPVKNGIDPLNQALPEAINETDSTINSVITSRLLDRSHGNQPGVSAYHRLWQNAPLFENLRSRPLKIAHLQHLYFHNERPFQVGNSWGSQGVLQALTWFDRFYFSGLAIHSETDPFTDLSQLNPLWQAVPNRQAVSLLLAQQNPEATLLASRLLASQQFNIHSTSVAAWTAALNGLSYQDWPSVHYTNAESNGPLSIQQQSGTHAFTRFSQSLAECYQAPVTPVPSDASPIAASEFYRRGLRHFEPSQLKQLATNIVTLLKERTVPFASMEAFLSPATAAAPSLLERAIAMTFAPQGRQHWDHSWETDGLRGPPETRLDIDHFAPGHLSQADLLAGIGPHLAPRSDTFSIRAFAMTSPTAGTSKIIGLEARLQRTPQTCKLQPTVGRRFVITNLRWLKAQDL
jgi:hypothetical protein